MRAFLFIGGEYPESHEFRGEWTPGDFIACADSGVERALEWGLEPELVVGDMDSISSERVLEGLPPGCELRRLAVDKDETDTEAALEALWERGRDEVILVGGGGGRLDHLLGIFGLFERSPRPSGWLCRGQKAEALEGRAGFPCAIGETISVFPLGGRTLRMRSAGLRWELEGLSFPLGYYGISNRTVAARVELEVLEGIALIIRPYPDRRP